MLGYIIYGDGPKRPVLEEQRIAGGRFMVLRMGEPLRPKGPIAMRRARTAARRLREAGVRSAVFPMDFPYTALFLRQGVCPVETLGLKKALAAPLTRRRLEGLNLMPTEAVVGISGERMSQELRDTVKALALSFRYVLLDIRDDGGLARELRREYGISLLLRPSPDQLERADALLLFSPRGDLSGGNRVLYMLYPGGEGGRGRLPLVLPPALAQQTEPNCDREQLAAALFAQGTLTLETLLAEIPC